MARHHMAGTADRPTRMLISRCPRFLRDAFLSTVRIRSAAEYHASFETKRREKERDREEEKFKRIVLRAERPDELSSERSSERGSSADDRGIGSRPPLCDFTATFRQSAGTKWPIVARLKRRAEGSAMIFGNQPFFLFTGGGRGKYG